MHRFRGIRFAWALALVLVPLAVPATASASASFIGGFSHNDVVTSTSLPPKNDVNPYGVAVVPHTKGRLQKGDVLVSNFNNAGNLQGTGTTIVEVSPQGQAQVFADLASTPKGMCPGGIGLTTALGVLRHGDVVVGSLPDKTGMPADAKRGCLLVLDSNGQLIRTIKGGPINGPWDMAVKDRGNKATLFVANVLNGTVAGGGSTVNRGTVVRISLRLHGSDAANVSDERVIASGFGEKTDPSALVIGPTGLGLGEDGTLYVADTVASAIRAIPNADERSTSAGTGTSVSQGGALMAPLGLAIAPNDNILTVNGGDGNIVETTPQGMQFAPVTLDSSGAGTLFGLAVAPKGHGVYYVDDGTNTLNLLH